MEMRLTQAMVLGARGVKKALDVAPEDFRAVTTEDIIDGFLSVGEYRISPDESTPDEDIAADRVSDDEEIISEELAEIYLKQGLTEKAQQIYDKLKARQG